jgi:hypothetical protein
MPTNLSIFLNEHACETGHYHLVIPAGFQDPVSQMTRVRHTEDRQFVDKRHMVNVIQRKQLTGPRTPGQAQRTCAAASDVLKMKDGAQDVRSLESGISPLLHTDVSQAPRKFPALCRASANSNGMNQTRT